MQSNKSSVILGTGNISSLLIQYSGPAIAAMMASSLYNIIDRMFIGHGVGPLAISGMALTMPLMNLSAAFGAMVGAGGSTLVSIKMGQKDFESTERVLGNVVILNIILGIVFMFLGLVFLEPILYFFGASENTLPYAKDFMQVILAGNCITHLYLGLNNLMRSSGYPQKAMISTLLTVLFNLGLAPLFIFVFHWGLRGAALATILSQTIAFGFVCYHFSNKNSNVYFKKEIFKLDFRIIKDIFSIGMAPLVMHSCSCLVVILINSALKTHGGDFAIGAYGIINSVVMLFAMLVMGLNQGMQPIAGFNFGAGLMDRVHSVLKYTIFYATIAMTFAFIVGEFFPHFVASLFTSEAELIDISTRGLRVVVAVFPIVGFQMVVANYFQSIGKASKSVFLSATRQLLFLVPLLLVLPNIWGVIGVWASMPISDFISTIISAVLLYNERKKEKKNGKQ